MIGEQLTRLRTERGMSQLHLARAAGVTKMCVVYLEQGRNKDPHVSTVCALAQALGVKPSRLLEESAR